MKKLDSLGDRMKRYEDSSRFFLLRRMYTIIRIDGKAFHTYTRGLKRPFDDDLIHDMNETAKFLCQNIQGAKIGYVQSDEISIILTDFDDLNTSAWFDNNIQKIASVSASMAAAKFNQQRLLLDERLIHKLAFFDARVFQVPTKTEAINYLIWRQNDATRNSISSVAQSMYSHKELHGKNSKEMQEMIFQKGLNWNDLPSGYKRGRVICRQQEDTEHTFWDILITIPIFTQDKDMLNHIIPDNL